MSNDQVKQKKEGVEVADFGELYSTCPVCERKTLNHNTEPIEYWTCLWCQDVFIMGEIDGKNIITRLPHVKYSRNF